MPGLLAASPYKANVDLGSADRPVSSGTEDFIRKAISCCLVRVNRSGSPVRVVSAVQVSPVQLPDLLLVAG